VLRPWQTRTHCCRHKCFTVCPRAQHLLRTQIFCPGHKKCFWFCSETFCVRNKCFPVCMHGNTTFILCPARLRAQETSWVVMCPHKCENVLCINVICTVHKFGQKGKKNLTDVPSSAFCLGMLQWFDSFSCQEIYILEELWPSKISGNFTRKLNCDSCTFQTSEK